ncbi:MAG: type VI secretion system domain-containing protein [Nannocystaceae bacterium]
MTTTQAILADAAAEARRLLAPSPARSDASRPPVDDPRYVQLREEIDRPQSVEGGATDWQRVDALGRELLAEGLGDLLIAAYTARAAQRRGGVAGTAFALTLVRERLAIDCEGASPRRRRALASALRWWTRGAEAPLRRALTTERAQLEGATVDGLRALVDELASLARAQLGSQTPAFGELTGALERAAAEIERGDPGDTITCPIEQDESSLVADATSEPPPEPAAEPPPTPAPQPAAPAALPTAPPHTDAALASEPDELAALRSASSPGDLQRPLRRLGEGLLDAAEQLRRLDLRDPRAYALARQGLWIHLVAAPPIRAGKSSIQPRAPAAQRQLEALAAQRDWPAFIDAAERLLRRARLDLDLQREVADALAALDPPATAAAAIVQQRARELVDRLPALLELHDREGRALASPATLAWLRSPSASPRPAAPQPAVTASAEAPTDDAVEGDAAPFQRRLDAAEAALRDGPPALAKHLFAGLDEQVERHALERWRPDLARRVLAGRLRTADAAATREGAARRLGALCPEALAAALR